MNHHHLFCIQGIHVLVLISNLCLCANYDVTVTELDNHQESSSGGQNQHKNELVRYGALPPSNFKLFHIHPNESLSRQYHLEDFLWTGSGDGPIPSEQDGGLAWEDNDSKPNESPGGDGVIRVTKTMVLFRTVHTTIYPIEYTPTMVVILPASSSMAPSEATPRLVSIPMVTLSPTFSLLEPPDTSPDGLLSSSSNLYFGHSTPKPVPIPKPIPVPTASMPFLDKSVSIDEIDDNDLPPTKTGGTEVPLPDIHPLDTNSSYTANPLYWVLTTIKVDNDSLDTILNQQQSKTVLFDSKHFIFKREIQRTLATVYATAFKRHLLASLGIDVETTMDPSNNNKSNSNNTNNNRKEGEAKAGRKKRQVLNSGARDTDTEKIKLRMVIENETDSEFFNQNNFNYSVINGSGSSGSGSSSNELFLGLILRNSSLIPSNSPLMIQMQRNRREALALVARTVLNVTVTVVNMSQVDSLPQVNLNYIVWAEGNPVPASSAVEDLQMVSRQEMEKEIGYEVVNKAEALVASPLKETKVELATSPWLIVAIVSIAFVIILLVVVMLMIWKWKSNRLGSGDSSSRSRIVTPPPPIVRGRPESGSRSRHVDVDIETTTSSAGGGQGTTGIDNVAFLGPPSPTERLEVPLQWPLHRKKIDRKQSEDSSDQDQDQGQSKDEGGHHPHYQRHHKPKHQSRPKTGKKTDHLETIQERQSSLSSNLDRILTPEHPGQENEMMVVDKKETKKRRKHISVSPSSSEEGSCPSSDSNSSGVNVSGNVSDPSEKHRKKKLSIQQSPASSPSEKLRKQLETIENQLQKRGSPPTSDNNQSSSLSRRGTSSHSSNKNKSKTSDMISYGNLEVSNDAIARPMSSKARKILKTKNEGDEMVVVNVTKHRSSQRYEREEIETVETVTTEESFRRKRIGSSGEVDREDVISSSSKKTKSSKHDRRTSKEAFSHLSSESLLSSSSGSSSSSTDRDAEERDLRMRKKLNYLTSGGENGENPIGKMRKRFHRFLDDTFNVAGPDGVGTGKPGDGDSHSVPEETCSTTDEFSLRPKSASFGPPKSAWGTKSKADRARLGGSAKPQSALSQEGRKPGVKFSENLEATRIFERETDDSESNKSNAMSKPPSSSDATTLIYEGGQLRLKLSTSEPIFPNYPIYPDIPIIPVKETDSASSGSTNLITNEQQNESRPFHPNPAIPLILAIKEEIKRFEKVKVTKESNLMGSIPPSSPPT